MWNIPEPQVFLWITAILVVHIFSLRALTAQHYSRAPLNLRRIVVEPYRGHMPMAQVTFHSHFLLQITVRLHIFLDVIMVEVESLQLMFLGHKRNF